MLALPAAVRGVIDSVDAGVNADLTALDRQFMGLFIAAILVAGFSAGRHYMMGWLGERVVADLRSAVYRQVIGLSPTFFESTRTGELLSRLTTDTTLVRATAGVNLSITLRSLLMLIGGLVMLTLSSPALTGITLVLIPLVLVPLFILGRRVRALTRVSQDKVADTSGIAGETFNAIHTVQAFTLEALQAQRYDAAVAASLDAAEKRFKNRSWLTFFAVLFVFGAIVLVLRLGAHAVVAGEMSAGLLGQFLLYALIVAASAVSLSEMWGQLQQAAGALERIGELLSTEPDIASPASPKPFPAGAGGRIDVKAVDFCYPSRPQTLALQNFSLSVKPGETVALVGPSGAGKSTVFALLLRFYDPASGRIEVDGVDLREADLHQVRQRIGIVPQETIIFAASAAQNISYGRPGSDHQAVRDAAATAAALEFIDALPQGFDSELGERGTRLSGGQRQRIAIARAVLKDPPIMLLDEATSALDADSERAVQTALHNLMAERTTVVIAHRLATVLEADRIVVMDQGQVVASGTHHSLLAEGGLYARLAKLQFTGDAPGLV